MKNSILTTYLRTTAVIVIAAWLSGCCGMTNIQAHGGGAGGLASLGALILGSTAMQHLCEPDHDGEEGDEEPLPPPDTTPESREDTDESAYAAGISVANFSPLPRQIAASQQKPICLS